MTGSALRSIRGQVGAAIWLQSRDLLHLGGRRLLGPGLVIAYAVLCALLVVGGVLARGRGAHLPTDQLFTPIWLLWALLPAVGAGGGSLDSTTSLAPYPLGPPMLLASSWCSALLDVQYLFPVPVLLAATSFDFGIAGLPAALAFVAGGSALGQLAGWFAVAGLRARRGQSLLVTGAAVVALGGLVISRRSGDDVGRRLGTIPPARWLVASGRAASEGSWGPALGWAALLAAPVLLLTLVGPMLVRRATVARLAGADRGAGGAPLPVSPARALAAAGWRGVSRTTSWRASLLAVVAVPFLTTLLSDPLTFRTLVAVSLVSAGATLAANTWSFEAGGVTLLLSAPVRRGVLVVVRTAVLVAALATALGVATAGALVAGPLRAVPGDAGYAACLIVLVAASGMRTSVATASAADVDSLRARPATLTAVLLFGGRCLLGSLLLSAAWSIGPVGALVGGVGVLVYAGWALRGARRRLADGATLLAAFATTR